MKNIFKLVAGLVAMSAILWPAAGSACGGFFCQTLPIDQAGEQIVFRKDGSQTTAMVQIQFVGEASDFGWVVPVPSTPEFAVGSNQVFTQLELATRPQFNLTRTGRECDIRVQSPVSNAGSVEDSESGSGGGVVVESVQEVGSYIVTVLSGNDPQAVADWLQEREFQLSENGAQLLAPYIEDQMKFVAVKLQDNRDDGDIQPLILKYQSEKPVVPIRLTAVAALDDMGVLVWVVGDARAVPENYLHVTPNYTRLNWYTGSNNAYASYQGLITDAMDEAGGQGFATDYAGRFNNLASRLPSADALVNNLNRLGSLSNAEYINGIVQNFSSDPSVLSVLNRELPIPQGQSTAIYFDPVALAVTYTAEELSNARTVIDEFIRTMVIEPMRASVDLLDDNRYLTRLYTTLSSDEMTVDPAFVFNSDMGDQALDRNAVLDASCIDGQSSWTLTLGKGTGRDDVLVIDTDGPVPLAAPTINQEASWKIEETADSGLPVVTNERSFQIAAVGEGGGSSNGGTITTGGGGGFGPGLGLIFGLAWIRRR